MYTVFTDKLEKLTGVQLGTLVNTKQVSPTEVIKYFADRIEKRNPSINSFTYTKIDEALAEATTLENKIMSSDYDADEFPFAGVPICLKDFLPSKKGWTNSHGGVKSLIAVDDVDSEFYKAARKLGAIAIGKSNAPAFGFSGLCENKLYGSTRNPFNTEYTSGGSSGGTAAAVADGLVTFGEGGDAGGSIRIPSSWCNLFGYKPSLGTVPSYCRPDAWSATHPYCFNGCLTKSIQDSAIMLTKMAGYNPRDPISLPINSGCNFEWAMHMPTDRLRIGYTFDFGLYQVDPEIREIMESQLHYLSNVGIKLEEIPFDFKHSLEELAECWAWSISVDTALDLEKWKSEGLDLVKDHRDELTEEFIYFNERAARATIQDFRKFNEIRTDILDQFENAFEKYDIILSPTCTRPPFKADYKPKHTDSGYDLSFISFGETFIVNFVGYPAASVPMGFTLNQLPAGMQIIGKQYKDVDVFSVANTIENLNMYLSDYSIPHNRII